MGLKVLFCDNSDTISGDLYSLLNSMGYEMRKETLTLHAQDAIDSWEPNVIFIPEEFDNTNSIDFITKKVLMTTRGAIQSTDQSL